tara:strand:+ start:19562 stop:20296 length:735 start_codon:yes stop_codon:yes gene_type:complete
MNKNIQTFFRYEFKYIISNLIREKIKKDISYFMKIDKYAQINEGEKYFVRSLYFEDYHNSNFYEKIDGVRNRRKYRLRTYSNYEKNNNLIFLEQKSRLENHVTKYRKKIDNSHIDLFYNNNRVFDLLNNYDDALTRSFLYDYTKKNIRPKVLVDYYRTPYISNFDMNFRLTIDQNIIVSRSNKLFNSYNRKINSLLDHSILEIKFKRRIPAWFHKIIMGYNLERISISKFVLGIKYTKLARDLS